KGNGERELKRVKRNGTARRPSLPNNTSRVRPRQNEKKDRKEASILPRAIPQPTHRPCRKARHQDDRHHTQIVPCPRGLRIHRSRHRRIRRLPDLESRWSCTRAACRSVRRVFWHL